MQTITFVHSSIIGGKGKNLNLHTSQSIRRIHNILLSLYIATFDNGTHKFKNR